MMSDIPFFDTSSLLIAKDAPFKEDGKFLVSSVTFNELEHIKTTNNKSQEVKYSARLLLHLFEEFPDKYEVVVHQIQFEQVVVNCSLSITNDTMILSDAIYANNYLYPDSVIFVTNDLALKHIANLFFGDGVIQSIEEKQDNYTGYKEINISDNKLAEFYEDPNRNHFNLLTGEYLILKNDSNEVIDLRKWDGSTHQFLNTDPFDSRWFGKIKPFNGDVYQKLAFDSLHNNKLTILRGKPGSGKSYLALGYLVNQLEHGKIDKIVIFCNPVATRDSAKMGFYPGDKNTKLLDSQIGNFLVGKFGDVEAVEAMIANGSLLLVPMADCRGMDLGIKAGVYVTEAQNTTIDIMQLLLQRIGEDCICVIEGDDKSQVDLSVYEGDNNGLRRASEVFRGQDYYGEVTLKNCHRSRIAERAELMRF